MRLRFEGRVLLDKKQTATVAKMQSRAMQLAASAVTDEIKREEIMPYQSGTLSKQTGASASPFSPNRAAIKSRAPYAKYIYNRGDFTFNRKRNKNAGAKWFEPYVSSDKNKSWLHAFCLHFMRLLGKH